MGEDIAIKLRDWRERITMLKEMGMRSGSALWMGGRRNTTARNQSRLKSIYSRTLGLRL